MASSESKVAIVGAGFIGQSWAMIFAAAGNEGRARETGISCRGCSFIFTASALAGSPIRLRGRAGVRGRGHHPRPDGGTGGGGCAQGLALRQGAGEAPVPEERPAGGGGGGHLRPGENFRKHS